MTLKEFRKLTENMPNESELIISIDDEGNDLKKLDELEFGFFRNNDIYDWEAAYLDDEITKKVTPSILIWPLYD